MEAKLLTLEEYRDLIELDQEIIQPKNLLTNVSSIDFLVHYIMGYFLTQESELVEKLKIQTDPEHLKNKRKMLEAILTIREPKNIPENTLSYINQLLQMELTDKKTIFPINLLPLSTTHSLSLYPAKEICTLWKGDITKLKVDAIVSATDKSLVGCKIPFHSCIDNAIHSAAGPQMRKDCAKIIEHQGALEEVGSVKITRAYNLPSKYVLHTVGPKIPTNSEEVINPGTELERKQLATCYLECLNLAAQFDSIRTIAFCPISTGVRRFPMKEAVQIALKAVNDWVITYPNRFEMVVFFMSSEEEYRIYEQVLKDGNLLRKLKFKGIN